MQLPLSDHPYRLTKIYTDERRYSIGKDAKAKDYVHSGNKILDGRTIVSLTKNILIYERQLKSL
jgi:hypothetical protein